LSIHRDLPFSGWLFVSMGRDESDFTAAPEVQEPIHGQHAIGGVEVRDFWAEDSVELGCAQGWADYERRKMRRWT
jgi:hypothetical protein